MGKDINLNITIMEPEKDEHIHFSTMFVFKVFFLRVWGIGAMFHFILRQLLYARGALYKRL